MSLTAEERVAAIFARPWSDQDAELKVALRDAIRAAEREEAARTFEVCAKYCRREGLFVQADLFRAWGAATRAP